MDYMFNIQMDSTVKTLKNRRGETDKLYILYEKFKKI